MTATLEAVVVAAPGQEGSRPSRERVAAQSRGARDALSISARLSGADDCTFEKDADDVPLAHEGWHWSVSHDATWVAAVVGRERVGIDVERMEARREEMVEALISPSERDHLPGDVDGRMFARLWTAKEAVLKSAGIGLGELSRCTLSEPMGEESVVLEHRGERCVVRQRIHGEHVLSVHMPGEDWEVRWHVKSDDEALAGVPEAPESPGATEIPTATLERAARAAADLGGEYDFAPHFMQVDGGFMHYVDEGPRDAPVLLALHGNPTWSFFYRDVIRTFRDRMRVVAPDHIGCGLSDKPGEWSYDLDGHIGNIARLIERLDLRNITLLVHDWGGAIGMGAALLLSERIERLVVTNTAAFPSSRMPWRIRVCRFPVLGRLAVQGFNAFAGAATFMAVERPLSKDVKRGFLWPYDNWSNRAATWRFVDDIPMGPSHRSYELLAQIGSRLDGLADRPTLILWGEKDWCFTPHFRREWEERFPEAESHPIKHAGHYLLEDARDEVLTKIEGFLCAPR